MQTDSKQRSQNPPSNHRPSWKLILALAGIGIVGVLGFKQWSRSRQFEAAVQAYESGDCQRSIAGFKSFDGNPEVEKVRRQCRDYQAIDPATQKPSEALAKAMQFLQAHPSNAFSVKRKDASSGNPLHSGLRQQLNPHLKPDRITDWLSMEVCQQLQKPTENPYISLAMKLESTALLPQSEESLPRLYHTCGSFLVAMKEVPAGIALFEAFLNKFPQHPRLGMVKRDHAMALVQEAKLNPTTGQVSHPIPTASTNDGSTQLVVRNDSPHALRIVFAGPTSQVEEMPACKDCEDYTRSNAPGACPNKGPVKTYKIEPGGYQVLVKAIISKNWNTSKLGVQELNQTELKQSSEVTGVRPFTGDWSFGTGQEYQSCFFLIRG
jgi:hypothetical protein